MNSLAASWVGNKSRTSISTGPPLGLCTKDIDAELAVFASSTGAVASQNCWRFVGRLTDHPVGASSTVSNAAPGLVAAGVGAVVDELLESDPDPLQAPSAASAATGTPNQRSLPLRRPLPIAMPIASQSVLGRVFQPMSRMLRGFGGGPEPSLPPGNLEAARPRNPDPPHDLRPAVVAELREYMEATERLIDWNAPDDGPVRLRKRKGK
jgi:hypothetical protein